MCIYIYIERERERDTCIHVYLYMYNMCVSMASIHRGSSFLSQKNVARVCLRLRRSKTKQTSQML